MGSRSSRAPGTVAPPRWLAVAWAGLCALGLALSAADGPAGAQSVSRQVKTFPDVGLTLVDEAVSDVAWSTDGRFLAVSKRDPLDWYMKIWAVRAEGTTSQCLTCDPPAPAKHCGSAAWHPSGEYVVFAAENGDVRSRKGDMLAEPGIGLNTNLWAMTADGSHAWPLTKDATNDEAPRGVIHPQFSPDGDRLFWAGPVTRYDVRPGLEWGEWALFLADFRVDGGTPSLANVRTLQPGEQHGYYESHDWSPDGRFLLFGAQLEPDHPATGLDLYEYELATGEIRRLTRTAADWDAHGRYTADGRAIYWMSSRGLGVRIKSLLDMDWMRDMASDLWIMKRDGSDPRRVTWFNQSGRRDSDWFRQNVYQARRVFGSDLALNDGASKAALVLSYEGRLGQTTAALVVIDLDRRRPDWQ